MTPTGPRGSGERPFVLSSSEAGEVGGPVRPELPSLYSSEPPAPESIPGDPLQAPHAPILFAPFNPKARDGAIGRELPYYKRTMERAGYRVVAIETVAEEQARGEGIFQAAVSVFEEASLKNQRVIASPYGGDGTAWETAEQVIPAAGISLKPGETPPHATELLESRVSFFLPKKGTASDNAVQLGSPGRIPAMPKFLRRAVLLPFWFPTVEVRERPGEYRIAGHNYGLGESGFIFHTRAQNYRANPKNPLNRGLFSYFRLLPKAIFNRYGLLGFDVHLRHFGADDRLIQEATRRGCEVIVTPNRIMAGVGGVPGAWGETKIVVLPSGWRGLLPLGEYVFRGLATKVGLNLVGPKSRLRTLSAESEWSVQPGNRVEVEIRVPNTVWWDILRTIRQSGTTFRGLFDPKPEIPAAGELLKVPAQLNGNLAPPSSGFTVRSPGVGIMMDADPDKLAVRLARSSALVDGETPLISDYKTTSFLRNHHPEVLEDTPEALRVRTPFISRPRLMDLLNRHHLPFQRGIELLTALQRVEERDQLGRLSDRNLTLERAREFLETNPGQAWTFEHRGEGAAFGERLLTQGVPLLAGIGAMLGAEHLADGLGLDPIRQRELRFGLVVYLSHAATTNFSPFWEVTANRILGRPYDFIRMRYARAAGEVFTQYTFESHSSLLRAWSASYRSGALGIEAGVEMALWRRAVGIGAIPLRAAWNMGEGILLSRLTEQAVRNLPEDSALRRYAPTAAFFLPDLSRLLAPQSATRFFGTRPMRLASRAFAAGFIGDMAFTGLHRVANRERATYELELNHRAAELRRARGEIGWFSWRTLPRILAPTLSDYLDSHNWLMGRETDAHQQIRSEDERQSSLLQENLRAGIPWLVHTLNTTPQELFGQEIRLSEVEADMLQQIQSCRGRGQLAANATFEETAVYLRRQFRGVVHSSEEAKRHLARIHAHELQQQAAMLSAVEIPENAPLRTLFDERGRLRPDREGDLARWVQNHNMLFPSG